jgi:hypothetical protein
MARPNSIEKGRHRAKESAPFAFSIFERSIMSQDSTDSMDSIDTPYVVGMNYGVGVNFMNGSIAGKGIVSGPPVQPTQAIGQSVRYTLSIVKSFEDLYTSLGISVAASGHFGLFKGSAKFDFATESKFNSQSTFILARCVVDNAFSQIEDARVVPDSDAYDLVKNGRQDDFTKRYGNGFVRGLQTGGEYFAVISITSSSREEQENIAASLSASYGGVFASASLDAKLDDKTRSKMARSEIQISTYQRGGVGDELALAADLDAVMARLMKFPAQVKSNPVPYAAQLARYFTLALPDGPNPVDIEAQIEHLKEYASTRLKMQTLRNDIEFIQTHPDLFVDPPDIATLNGWQDFLTTALNNLTHQASVCIDNPKDGCPLIAFQLPPDYRPVQRRKSNAIDVFAAENSFPDHVFMRTIDAPADMQVTTRLVTEFQDDMLPGAYVGIGFALYADSISRAVWFLKGIGDTGRSVSCYASGRTWDGPNVDPVGSALALYPDDEIQLRLAKKGNQLLDVSYSRDGADWKQLATFVDLADLGFAQGTPLRLAFTAYSTVDKTVGGTFYDTNIVAI